MFCCVSVKKSFQPASSVSFVFYQLFLISVIISVYFSSPFVLLRYVVNLLPILNALMVMQLKLVVVNTGIIL